MASTSDRSRQVAAVFDQVAQTYEEVGIPWFAPIAEGLVSRLEPVAGERALDIGCGKGAATFGLAEAVGSAGQVVGVDLSVEMLAAAEHEARRRGIDTIEWQVMDAAEPNLAASSFDLVAASLVLFFLPDPLAALVAWRALLRPDGRLGITTFSTRDPAWVALDDVFRPYLPPQLLDPRTSGESGPFSSDDGVEQLMSAAGLTSVATSHFDVQVSFGTVDEWATWSRSHGQRVMWNCVPDSALGAVLANAGEHLEKCRRADGRMVLTQKIRVTMARA